MNPLSVMMFAFGAMLLMFAGICFMGDTGLIRSFNWTKVKDKKAYARFLGTSLAQLSFVIMLSGIVAWANSESAAGVFMVIGSVMFLIRIASKSKDYYG